VVVHNAPPTVEMTLDTYTQANSPQKIAAKRDDGNLLRG
jgi:hypothetical protein